MKKSNDQRKPKESRLDEHSFQFMQDLWENNNKTWFDENRIRYESLIREPIKKISIALTDPVSDILPDFIGKPKISRINNDLRFQKNKPPYKEHVWISFPVAKGLHEIFAAVSRNGWTAGCGLFAGKRDLMDVWRRNIIEKAETWRKYWNALSSIDNPEMFIEGKYKKLLFNDIPDDLIEAVQAKALWIVLESKEEFTETPEREFFKAICKIIPIYLFMYCSGNSLSERLLELCESITPPDKEIGLLWKTLRV